VTPCRSALTFRRHPAVLFTLILCFQHTRAGSQSKTSSEPAPDFRSHCY